jgi:hypothetical protein
VSNRLIGMFGSSGNHLVQGEEETLLKMMRQPPDIARQPR